jgi:hypothetical protein
MPSAPIPPAPELFAIQRRSTASAAASVLTGIPAGTGRTSDRGTPTTSAAATKGFVKRAVSSAAPRRVDGTAIRITD